LAADEDGRSLMRHRRETTRRDALGSTIMWTPTTLRAFLQRAAVALLLALIASSRWATAAVTLELGAISGAPGETVLLPVFASSNSGDVISGFNLPLDVGLDGNALVNLALADAPIQNALYASTSLNSNFNAVVGTDGVANGDGGNVTLSSSPLKLFDLALEISPSVSSAISIPASIKHPTTPVNLFTLAGPGTPTIASINAGVINVIVEPLVDADFNDDGQVDGADFLLWQRALGTVAPNIDVSGNGIVDAADLTAWRDAFGTTELQAAGATLPEPCTAGLATLATVTLLCVARRQQIARTRRA
jgi:hypothetical protein